MDSGTFDARGHGAARTAHQREAFLPGCERAHRLLRPHASAEYTVASVRLSLLEWATRDLAEQLGPPSRTLRASLEIAGLLAGAVAAGLLLPLPIWATLGAAAVVSAWRLRRCPPRCSARRLARRIEGRLQAGSTLEEVSSQLSSLLAVYPHDDNARFLLALDRLNDDEPLEALMQLAPLRARHPDVIEVDLASALAELQLGRWPRAQEILEAIELTAGSLWGACVQQLERACRSKARQVGTGQKAAASDVAGSDSTGRPSPRRS